MSFASARYIATCVLLVALISFLTASVKAAAGLRGNAARRNPAPACHNLKAALIWDGSENDVSSYTIVSDMQRAFGEASSSAIQHFTQRTGYPTTLAELLPFDVIVVEGGGAAGVPVLSWLNTAGKDLLELAANAGVNIFVQASLGGTNVMQVDLPFGAQLTPLFDSGKQQYARVTKFPESPLNSAESPVAEFYTGVDSFARASVIGFEDFGLQVFLEDAKNPTDAFVFGGSTLIGSHVLFSGASPTGAWAAIDATEAVTENAYSPSSPLVQSLRLNMMNYVCQGALSSTARQDRQ